MLTNHRNLLSTLSMIIVLVLLLSLPANLALTGPSAAEASADDSKEKDKSSNKFDHGLNDKIKAMIANGESRDYEVIIFVEEGQEESGSSTDETYPAKANKDKLTNALSKKHKAKDITYGEVLPIIVAKVPLNELEIISSYDYVELIGDGEKTFSTDSFINDSDSLLNSKTKLTLNESLPNSAVQLDMSTADDVVKARLSGKTGAGIRVAVLDTGIRATHDDLDETSKIIYQKDLTGFGMQDAYGSTGHGTHVSSIIAGSGETSCGEPGIATGAKLIIVKVGHTGNDITSSNVARGLDYALAKGAKVINMSFGDHAQTQLYDSMAKAADLAVEKGAVVVVSAGNYLVSNPTDPTSDVPQGTIFSPATAFNVITVAAVNDHGQSADLNQIDLMKSGVGVPANYYGSGRGPTWDGRIKPDVLAPGQDIKAANASGDTFCVTLSGTSQAAPIVSGAAAQVLEAHPTWTPAQVKAALKYTASKDYDKLRNLDVTLTGKGLINIEAAVALSSTNSAVMSEAYGFDLSTYVVTDPHISPIGPSNVLYKLDKSGTSGISIIDAQLKVSALSTHHKIFDKSAFASIKIGTETAILDDTTLYAAPWIDYSEPGKDEAPVRVVYYDKGVKITLDYRMETDRINPYVHFSSSTTKTYEIVHYLDFNFYPENSYGNNKDKAFAKSSSTTPFTSEKKDSTNGFKFYLKDEPSMKPYIVYKEFDSETTVWILRHHLPTATPDTYFDSENFVSGGDSIVADYWAKISGKGSKRLGPSISVQNSAVVSVNAADKDSLYDIANITVEVYNSTNYLIGSGVAPFDVNVPRNDTYTIKFYNTGTYYFTNADIISESLGNYYVYSWGGSITVPVNDIINTDVIAKYYNHENPGISSLITIQAQDMNGQPINGIYVEIQDSTRIPVSHGYTPFSVGIPGDGTALTVHWYNSGNRVYEYANPISLRETSDTKYDFGGVQGVTAGGYGMATTDTGVFS